MLLTNDSTYIGNLKPISYKWAYDLYEQAIRNTWFPHEIQLGEDIGDWERLTADERHAVTYLMSYFNPSEFLVNNALAFGVYPFVAPAECKMYLARQMFEEANHSMSFEYVLETFKIAPDKAYSGRDNYESMALKEAFVMKYLNRMTTGKIDVETIEGKQFLLKNLVAYNIVMEGIWFYSGFMLALSFRQRNLLRNFASMIDWVLRDESLHLQFGMNLILTMLEEYPEIMNETFASEIHTMILEAVELERQYNKDAIPHGILGLNADYINQYVEYITDRRLEELGFEAHFKVTNPAKWMATATDVPELVNFFEATNTTYESNARSSS